MSERPSTFRAGVAAGTLLLGVLAIGGCESGPPSTYRVTGQMTLSGNPGIAEFELKDAYVWRQPTGTAAFVLFSDRALPELAPEDTFPVVDLGLALTWARAPLLELELDAQGEFVKYSARGGDRGGQSAECVKNTGACRSGIGYWGDDAISASYEFGHDVDATVAQPIHRQTAFQTPVTSSERVDSQGNRTQRSGAYYDLMAARYQRVRAALDKNRPEAFLAANGFDQVQSQALLGMDGLADGIARLAITCPRPDGYESFANDGGFGSLLIHTGDAEKAVYFVRRGEDWLLQGCGSD